MIELLVETEAAAVTPLGEAEAAAVAPLAEARGSAIEPRAETGRRWRSSRWLRRETEAAGEGRL